MTQPKPSRLPRGAGMYCASAIWGTWVLVLNATQLQGPFVLYTVGVPTITGFLGLLAWLAFNGRLSEFRAIFSEWKLARWAMLVAVIEIVQSLLHLGAFQMAIRDGGSMLIPVVRSFMGVCTPLMALLLSREERFSPYYLAVGALATAGATCICVWGKFTLGDQISLLALGMVFASMLMACMIALIMRIIAVEAAAADRDPMAILAFQTLIMSGLMVLPLLLLPMRVSMPDNLLRAVAILAVVGLTHVSLGFVARQYALRTISGQHAAIIGYTEAIVSVTNSVLFLREELTAGFVVGALMIVGAAIGAQYVALRHSALKHSIPG